MLPWACSGTHECCPGMALCQVQHTLWVHIYIMRHARRWMWDDRWHWSICVLWQNNIRFFSKISRPLLSKKFCLVSACFILCLFTLKLYHKSKLLWLHFFPILVLDSTCLVSTCNSTCPLCSPPHPPEHSHQECIPEQCSKAAPWSPNPNLEKQIEKNIEKHWKAMVCTCEHCVQALSSSLKPHLLNPNF